ncbi:hypothetical protein L596_030165 [Steinernema carpocapsae]|uniref:Uncharacterized protein n=1 Tax=Steinernema carpocapsae TaxID=34508 RepID=A0A4U5LRW8_STECR|nr:hypothetical protein L596_030165 [Steinernema carpocapsae]
MTLPKDVDICVKLLPASPSAAYRKGTALRQPRALARARNVVPAENFGRSRIPGPGKQSFKALQPIKWPFRSPKTRNASCKNDASLGLLAKRRIPDMTATR